MAATGTATATAATPPWSPAQADDPLQRAASRNDEAAYRAAAGLSGRELQPSSPPAGRGGGTYGDGSSTAGAGVRQQQPAPHMRATPPPSSPPPTSGPAHAGGVRMTTPSPHHPRQGPRSAYYTGPPGKDSIFGTAPCGVIGRDKPREIVRIERDYTGGELCQFHPTFPLELEGRIAPVTFSETINDLNMLIIEANHAGWACLDNSLAVLSLYLTPFVFGSKYQREMKKLKARIDEANQRAFNPVGLNIRSPSETAFLFLEIEYF